MEQTLAAPAHEVPEAADLAFEDPYRSSRDDVFAYAAGLLRDRSAAEDVTAAAFERAFRKVSACFNPRLFVPGATASHDERSLVRNQPRAHHNALAD